MDSMGILHSISAYFDLHYNINYFINTINFIENGNKHLPKNLDDRVNPCYNFLLPSFWNRWNSQCFKS